MNSNNKSPSPPSTHRRQTPSPRPVNSPSDARLVFEYDNSPSFTPRTARSPSPLSPHRKHTPSPKPVYQPSDAHLVYENGRSDSPTRDATPRTVRSPTPPPSPRKQTPSPKPVCAPSDAHLVYEYDRSDSPTRDVTPRTVSSAPGHRDSISSGSISPDHTPRVRSNSDEDAASSGGSSTSDKKASSGGKHKHKQPETRSKSDDDSTSSSGSSTSDRKASSSGKHKHTHHQQQQQQQQPESIASPRSDTSSPTPSSCSSNASVSLSDIISPRENDRNSVASSVGRSTPDNKSSSSGKHEDKQPKQKQRDGKKSSSGESKPKRAKSAGERSNDDKKESTKSKQDKKNKKKKRRPHEYMLQPDIRNVVVFRNGTHDYSIGASVRTLPGFLQWSTEKLGLTSAARRAFLADGKEVKKVEDIQPNAEVFVSCGEPYSNPDKSVHHANQRARSARWTMSGVEWEQGTPKQTTQPQMSARFKSLIVQSGRRVFVLRNGRHTRGGQVVASPGDWTGLLMSATHRVELGTPARRAYDWSGRELNDLSQIPQLDPCLQSSGTPVLGPIWVSAGEGFDPIGPSKFLEQLISKATEDYNRAEHYKKQLKAAESEDTRKDVEIKAILSMSKQERQEALQCAEDDMKQWEETKNSLKEHRENLDEQLEKQQSMRNSYTMQHIKEVDANDKIVGTYGINIQVFANGSTQNGAKVFFNIQQAERGIQNFDSKERTKKLLALLLDACSHNVIHSDPKASPAIRPVAQKMFDEHGTEIVDIYQLENDQNIWLSFGEDWVNPRSYALLPRFERVKAVFHMYKEDKEKKDVSENEEVNGKEDVNENEEVNEKGERLEVIYKDDFDSNVARDMEEQGKWKWITGVPDDVKWKEVKHKDDFESLQERGMSHPEAAGLMARKSKPKDPERDFLLLPSVCVDERPDKKTSEDNENTKKGKKKKEIPLDKWVITKSGHIHSRAFERLVLAVTGPRFSTRLPGQGRVQGAAVGLQKKRGGDGQVWRFTNDGYIVSESEPDLVLTCLGESVELQPEGDEDSSSGELDGVSVAVCEKLDPDNAAAQGQRWAVKQENFHNLGQWKHNMVQNPEWNKRAISWPVDEDGEWNDNFDWPVEGVLMPGAPPIDLPDNKGMDGMVPLRLWCMRNGSRDFHRVTSVVGPDLTNMNKELGASQGDDVDVDQPMPGADDLTLHRVEMRMFLERCTSMMDLPFAGRRVFDEAGVEHFSLSRLSRDQLVYVSCGENFQNPNLTHYEQQRRQAIGRLRCDVEQIGRYVALVDSICEAEDSLVLSVKDGLYSGSKVIVSDQSEDDSHSDDGRSTDTQSSNEKRGPQPVRWRWEAAGGRLVCDDKPQLVAALAVRGGHGTVVLARRNDSDPAQRWVLANNGIISPRINRRMAITVTLPPGDLQENQETEVTLAACDLGVQQVMTCQSGRANQRWAFDKDSGHISAFRSDCLDVEVTVANRTNVCTYAVVGDIDINQQGYLVEVGAEGSRPLLVCVSCARAMAGRHRLRPAGGSTDFVCGMANAAALRLPQRGAFQCVNARVDLSRPEAAHTLDEWSDLLERLDDPGVSAAAVAREVAAVPPPYSVTVRPHRQGGAAGGVIVGSSMDGLIDQATASLELPEPADRLTTADGLRILEVDDLVDWTQDAHREREQRNARREALSGENAQEKDICLGQFDPAGADPQTLDPETSVGHILVPTPTQGAPTDGVIVAWQLAAHKEGKVLLQVYRPEAKKKNHMTLTLIHQSEVQVNEGHNDFALDDAIDIIAGDLIGFQVVEAPVVPYVVDKDVEGPLGRGVVKDAELDLGQGVKLDLVANEKRRYAFGAVMRMVPKITSRPSQELVLSFPIDAHFSHGEEEKEEEEGEKEKEREEGKEAGFGVSEEEERRALDDDTGDIVYSDGYWEARTPPERRPRPKQPENCNADSPTPRFYALPDVKRIRVFPNGRRKSEAIFVWGSSLKQIYQNATSRLHLERPGKQLHSPEGDNIDEFDDLAADTLVCMSHDGKFRSPKSAKQTLNKPQKKSARGNKFDIEGYTARSRAEQRSCPQDERPQHQPPDVRRVRVYQANDGPDRDVTVWGDSLVELLQRAADKLAIRRRSIQELVLLTEKGHKVKDFKALQRDQFLMVARTGGGSPSKDKPESSKGGQVAVVSDSSSGQSRANTSVKA